MIASEPNEQALIEKIRTLPVERQAEVEDFVDFLRPRAADRELASGLMRASEPAFRELWDNPEDAAYDAL